MANALSSGSANCEIFLATLCTSPCSPITDHRSLILVTRHFFLLFTRLVVPLRGHQFLLVLRGKLWPVDRERDFVDLAGEGERQLIVLVLHRLAGGGADVETLVPRQDKRDGVLHRATRREKNPFMFRLIRQDRSPFKTEMQG